MNYLTTKSFLKILILCIGASLLLSGCGQLFQNLFVNSDEKIISKRSITGIIRDKNKSVVISADVYLYHINSSVALMSTKTDSTGKFVFSDVPTGSFNILAQSSNTQKVFYPNVTFNETEADRQLGYLDLQETGTLSGRVTLEASTDYVGIDVYIPGTSFMAKTDWQGNYKISYIPPGTYEVMFEKLSFIRQSTSNISVESDKNTALSTILLQKYYILGKIKGKVSLEPVFPN